MANSNLRYVRGLTVPKTIGTGRKLMHNNVRHTVNMPTGVNGFRAWTDTKVPAGFIRCPCGWSGLPHYAGGGPSVRLPQRLPPAVCWSVLAALFRLKVLVRRG